MVDLPFSADQRKELRVELQKYGFGVISGWS